MLQIAVPLGEAFLRCVLQGFPLLGIRLYRPEAVKQRAGLRQAFACDDHQAFDVIGRIAQRR